MNERREFFGKYRGVVRKNDDPERRGRIKATVPDVLGNLESGWAEAAVPFAGKGMGFFAVPSPGAGVWIEFECGDPDFPIWTGCWWGTADEVPKIVYSPAPPDGTEPKVVISTKGGHRIVMDDTSNTGGITLETSGGQKIILSAGGIEISDGGKGSIKISGKKVSINGDALEVT